MQPLWKHNYAKEMMKISVFGQFVGYDRCFYKNMIDSIIHKGVRTKDMLPVGNVTTVTNDFIIITSEGAIDEYNVPKDEVKAYNGSEVILNATFNRFEQFKVKVKR